MSRNFRVGLVLSREGEFVVGNAHPFRGRGERYGVSQGLDCSIEVIHGLKRGWKRLSGERFGEEFLTLPQTRFVSKLARHQDRHAGRRDQCRTGSIAHAVHTFFPGLIGPQVDGDAALRVRQLLGAIRRAMRERNPTNQRYTETEAR